MWLNNFGMYLAGAFWPALFIVIGFALGVLVCLYKNNLPPKSRNDQ